VARPNSSDGKTEAALAKMCRASGSGQPLADHYRKAAGTRLRVAQSGWMIPTLQQTGS